MKGFLMAKNKVDLKTVQDVESPDISGCPYCGCDEYYTNVRYSGEGVYRYRFDGETAYNGEMYDCLKDTIMGKFAYCCDCNKRIFRIKD